MNECAKDKIGQQTATKAGIMSLFFEKVTHHKKTYRVLREKKIYKTLIDV